MYSIIADANFIYEEMRLGALRDRIIDENNLSILDIVKGFHDMSEIRMAYDDFEFSEDEKKDIHDIYAHFQKLAKEKIEPFFQQVYDAYYQEKYAELKKAYDESGISDITLDEIIKCNNKSKDPNKKEYGDSTFRNAFNLFVRSMEASFGGYIFDREVMSKVNFYALNVFEEYLKGFSRDEKYITDNTAKDTVEGFYLNDNFPSVVDLNGNTSFDFSSIYIREKDDKSLDDDFGTSKRIIISFTDYLGNEAKHSIQVPCICMHIDSFIARKYFEDKLSKAVFDRIGTPGVFKYAQNLEAQPITININTKTGKHELIDGYKRLLLTADKNLLNMTAPVRVFRDLDDKGFLALLYAANLWKKSSSGVSNASFHDRGYLFALKTRFGFEIPKEYYESRSQGQTLSGYRTHSDLDIFYMYDFGFVNMGSYSIRGDISNSLKDICKKETNRSFYDNLQEKVHLIDDMQFFYGEYQKITDQDYGYDSNIRDGLAVFIIRQVGRIRALGDTENQNKITAEMITDIFGNKDYVKAFSKKHFSTMTYVDNFLRDKGYYREITQTLYDNLVSLDKEKLQDNEAEEDNDLEL